MLSVDFPQLVIPAPPHQPGQPRPLLPYSRLRMHFMQVNYANHGLRLWMSETSIWSRRRFRTSFSKVRRQFEQNELGVYI